MNQVFYKENKDDRIWWIDNPETKGEFLFSFDKKVIFNLFADYPHNLTPEQKATFDNENPYWMEFFSDRTEGSEGLEYWIERYSLKFGSNYPIMIVGSESDEKIISDIQKRLLSGKKKRFPRYEIGVDY